jgi:monoamine oxidase
MRDLDIAIVGGGTAGLAAAAALVAAGLRPTVLEARGRLGGRVWTEHDPGVPLPLELGAEFVHGAAPRTRALLADAGAVAVDLGGEHWRWIARQGRGGPGGPRREPFSRRIDRVLRGTERLRHDLSVADLLERRKRQGAGLAELAAARSFVEGFHAADVADIGVQGIAADPGESPTLAAARSARVAGGYDAVQRHLARALPDIRLRHAVSAIDWRRGSATLTCDADGRATTLRARAVLVTVPIGVLQAGERGGLALRPMPAALRSALGKVAMGAVVRLVLWFHELPWQGHPRAEGLRTLSFLHLARGPFQVWWTPYPALAPLLVAWCGGPAARQLAGRSRGEVERVAIEALAVGLGMRRRRLEDLLERSWSCDWTSDPWSRGAYSYARVGGAGAARGLARSHGGTLFLAGEATDMDGATGTVEGALASGARAAGQIARALARS